ncbi:MAG: YjbQ family protein [Vallitaleaceae bacterium]|nr:YjbQ family protein [Vallitaleaceae bacterium]
MKSYRSELEFKTKQKMELINITANLNIALLDSGIKEGLLLCNTMHLTSSVFVNDHEHVLHKNFQKWLEQLSYETESDSKPIHADNSEAHLKRSILGREVVIAVTEGKLDFGPWEQVFYGEFDGMRKKKVLIKIIGE